MSRWCASTAVGEAGPGADDAAAVVVVGSAYAPLSGKDGQSEGERGGDGRMTLVLRDARHKFGRYMKWI